MSSASVGGGIRIHRVLVRAFELIAYYLLRSCNPILIPLGRLEVMKLIVTLSSPCDTNGTIIMHSFFSFLFYY